MSRPTRIILIYAAGFLLAAILTVLANPKAEYEPWAFHYFGGDYVKTGEVYEKLIVHQFKVDDLFMGSSHTFNGIDDEMIDRALGPRTAYNAAIPTSGRDFEYVVLKRILARSPPKRLFLEVRETEERTSHFGFPIVATVREILTAPPNLWWLKNLLYAIQYRFERLTWLVPTLRRTKLSETAPTPYGYRPNEHQVPQAKLAAEAADVLATKRWRILPKMFGDLEFSANERYMRALARICKQHGVELHFLYLPFLGAPAEPMQASFYRSVGTLHTLPDSIRNNPRYFADPTHFNAVGAEAYTKWLIADVLGPEQRSATRAKRDAAAGSIGGGSKARRTGRAGLFRA